jgi:predicted 3-demethylubiquinone-9 3-methyltransferase (glyoxalase superfamily)
MPSITPFLWFDHQAEEAANLYVSIFPNSHIVTLSRYGDAGPLPKGTVMTVEFELDGQRITALNGGPHLRLNEAFSLKVDCTTQDEVDHYWERLSEGGDPAAQQCGWLKDRYGLSWQIIPTALPELLGSPDPGVSRRVMQAMLAMKKLDIAGLRRAAEQR